MENEKPVPRALQTTLDKLRAQISKLCVDSEGLRARHTTAVATARTLRTANEAQTEKIAELQTKVRNLRTERDNAVKELTAIRKELRWVSRRGPVSKNGVEFALMKAELEETRAKLDEVTKYVRRDDE